MQQILDNGIYKWYGYLKENKRMMKSKLSKVSVKDKNLWRAYASQVAVISSLITLISFCILPSGGAKWRALSLSALALFLVCLFIFNWCKANFTNHADLKINGTEVKIKAGDLFEQEGLKIIGVNNYMDLAADDIVISKTTLHGQFLMRHQDEMEQLEKAIRDSKTLILTRSERAGFKSYDYGSCVLYKDYVLTVLSKFDVKNKAYISTQEYIQFWMTFWDNIDVLYNAKTINIPIMGAGQTRFKGVRPEKQELLEIALWTLKKSGFCNNYAGKSINFVVYTGDVPEIDFYRIQKIFE